MISRKKKTKGRSTWMDDINRIMGETDLTEKDWRDRDKSNY